MCGWQSPLWSEQQKQEICEKNSNFGPGRSDNKMTCESESTFSEKSVNILKSCVNRGL